MSQDGQRDYEKNIKMLRHLILQAIDEDREKSVRLYKQIK
jgi:hypothetical protein